MSKKKPNSFDFNEFLKQLETCSPKLKRKQGIKPKRKFFLIVTEGGKTEPLYFENKKVKLPKHLLETVEIEGVGANTLAVVKRAIELKEAREESLKTNFDEVWAIFDKDEYPARNVNEAVALAERNGVKAGLCNESFELWYVLHFRYIDQKLTRDQYNNLLTEILGVKYDKVDIKIPGMIETTGNEKLAIRYSKRLEKQHKGKTPNQSNPFIGFYKLIEKLNKYIP